MQVVFLMVLLVLMLMMILTGVVDVMCGVVNIASHDSVGMQSAGDFDEFIAEVAVNPIIARPADVVGEASRVRGAVSTRVVQARVSGLVVV